MAQGSTGREDGSLQFDRILCDVPCSGDGTMRKAPDIWRRWTASNGNGLHALQINITLRACQLLKVRARGAGFRVEDLGLCAAPRGGRYGFSLRESSSKLPGYTSGSSGGVAGVSDRPPSVC